MKTTLDLEDTLLIEAKAIAAQRRTTLKSLVEHALRRELSPHAEFVNPDPEHFDIGVLGLPVFKRLPGDKPVTLEQIAAINQEIDDEEFQQAFNLRNP